MGHNGSCCYKHWGGLWKKKLISWLIAPTLGHNTHWNSFCHQCPATTITLPAPKSPDEVLPSLGNWEKSVLFLPVPNHCFSSSGIQAGTGGKLVPASMRRTTQPLLPNKGWEEHITFQSKCSCTCCQGVTTPRDICLKLIWEVAHAVRDGKWSTRGKGENKKEVN